MAAGLGGDRKYLVVQDLRPGRAWLRSLSDLLHTHYSLALLLSLSFSLYPLPLFLSFSFSLALSPSILFLSTPSFLVFL